MILTEAKQVRELLGRTDLGRIDLDDLMQEVTLAAISAVADRRYRPHPRIDPRFARRRWLIGIAVKKLAHLRDKASHRREVPRWDPWWRGGEPVEDAGRRLEAREAIGMMEELPWWARDVLCLAAQGFSLLEMADLRGISPGTAASRLRYARQKLAAMLRRRGAAPW
jgi:RNA polymerase sigma-70 factor, ECF subfamily